MNTSEQSMAEIVNQTYQTSGRPLLDDPKIRMRNTNVFYGEKQAIFDVNLDIGRNQVISMIGPSGCGKSTLLRAINRMNDLIEGCSLKGRILFDGADLYANFDLRGVQLKNSMWIMSSVFVGDKGVTPHIYTHTYLGHTYTFQTLTYFSTHSFTSFNNYVF